MAEAAGFLGPWLLGSCARDLDTFRVFCLDTCLWTANGPGRLEIPQQDAPHVLDSHALDRLRRIGGSDLIRRMIDLFFSHAGAKVLAVRPAAETGDLEAVERYVHSVKSSAGNLGAEELRSIAGQIEELAAERKSFEVNARIDDLEQAYARVTAILADTRKGLDG